MQHKALFLDRDGVINIDTGHLYKIEDVVFLEGIFTLCREAKAKGYLLIIITNQAGIGRGYYSERDFHTLMEWMKEQFAIHNAPLDAVYFCPHHPEYGIGAYKRMCNCRKPKPGMLLRAQNDWDIDMADSCFLGDKETDMQAGKAAGITRNILIENNEFPLSALIQLL